MTPNQNPETQPTPGQVIGEDDVAKLRGGDVLRRKHDGEIVYVTDVWVNGRVNYNSATITKGGAPCHAFTFIGRPGPDGFIPWTGGENPLPGQMVEVRAFSAKLTKALMQPDVSDTYCWKHRGLSADIIAFRLSPPAGSPPSSKTEHVAGDAVSGAVERLTALRDQARNGTPVTDPNEWEADELDAILSAVEAQAAEIADLKARNKALEEGLRQ